MEEPNVSEGSTDSDEVSETSTVFIQRLNGGPTTVPSPVMQQPEGRLNNSYNNSYNPNSYNWSHLLVAPHDQC